MSQNAAQWQAPAATQLVVKHGFLDELVPEPALRVGLSRRVASDSVLWRRGRTELDDSDNEPLEMVGECTSTAASDSTGADAVEGGTASPTPWSYDESGSGSTTPIRDSMSDLERLTAENARLASENERLRQQCCMETGCAAQVPAPMPFADTNSNDHTQSSSVPQPAETCQMPIAQQGVVWVFAMASQVPTQTTWCPMPMAASGVLPEGVSGQGYQEWMPQKTNQMRMGCRNLADAQVPSHVQRRMNAQRGMLDDDNVTDVKLEERTTVMLRNLPNNYTRHMLLSMMDSEGFAGQYDFVYLPIDFRTHASLGYAFINLVSPSIVPRFWNTFDGYTNWDLPSRKVCFVSWCGPHQGFEAHVQRYRSSPVMHLAVPDDFKPVVFKNGERVEFPTPTKKPRVPRVRNYVRQHA